jgi:hypothetical protein
MSAEPAYAILRSDGARIGWAYANGKLTEGPPRED